MAVTSKVKSNEFLPPAKLPVGGLNAQVAVQWPSGNKPTSTDTTYPSKDGMGLRQTTGSVVVVMKIAGGVTVALVPSSR